MNGQEIVYPLYHNTKSSSSVDGDQHIIDKAKDSGTGGKAKYYKSIYIDFVLPEHA